MKRIKKYRKLRPNDIIRIGDYVTLDAEFSPFKLWPIDTVTGCASGAWVVLSECARWLGARVKNTRYTVARKIKKTKP